ncbi:uncharacterized protein [Cicer arietinum]|uniref:uncharacterized protein n=1 Tax=Cicer arietinum TaxID=3827 RepID=UPI003CC6C1E0
MRRSLATKNKFKFVDGSIRVPNIGDLNYAGWERCNNLVHSWITNSTHPSIVESVVFIDNAMKNAKLFKLEDIVIQFLIGLNGEYQATSSQVLLMELLPQVNKVFYMILPQERNMNYGVSSTTVDIVDDPTALVNAVDGGRSYGRGKGG